MTTTPGSASNIVRPISRRRFLQRSALAVAGTGLFAAGSARGQSARAIPFRVIAYNVYGCTGWPRRDHERADQARSRGQLPERIALELSLYEPDLIVFSESPEEAVIAEIASALSMRYVFFPSGGNWPGALLTRLEIVESANVPLVRGQRPEDLFTRHWGMAVVQGPAEDAIVVHSMHLHPNEPPIRQREIAAVLESTEADGQAGRSVLVLGDLNHTPAMPEYERWIESGWVDTFAQVGNGDGYTIRADQPDRRIDYVLANGPIGELVVESRPLFEGAFRTNPEDPTSFALSDHLPQFAMFELPDVSY